MKQSVSQTVDRSFSGCCYCRCIGNSDIPHVLFYNGDLTKSFVSTVYVIVGPMNLVCFTVVRQCQLQICHTLDPIIGNPCSLCSVTIRRAYVKLAYGHVHRRNALQSTGGGVCLLVETKNPPVLFSEKCGSYLSLQCNIL